MELYFAATGNIDRLNFFEDQLKTLRMMLPFTTKEGKKMLQPIYGNLQPLRLYRYVFPKEALDRVLKTFNFPLDGGNYSGFNTRAMVLRKILKAKKIPPVSEEAKPVYMDLENIGLIGIGIKEDGEITDETGTHEAI